jgi:hypothetical protein
MPSFLDLPPEKPALSSPLHRLTELFHERFFYNDLISTHDDPQLASANLMAMLAFPGLLCLFWIPKYYVALARAPQAARDLAAFGDRFLWLSFEMAVLGLLTTLQWDRLFPDRRDYMILGPQPVSVRVLFEAQVKALARFLGMFFVIANLGSALFFPIAAAPQRAGNLEGLLFFAGHWVSLFAAGLFAVLVVIAMQGLLTNVLSPRLLDRVSPFVQSLLAALFLGIIVLLPMLPGRLLEGATSVGTFAQQNHAALALPPVWFAALGEQLAGRHGAVFTPLAGWAVLAIAGMTLAVAGTYLLSYQRFLRRSLESTGQQRAGESWAARALRGVLRRTWLKDPSERVAFLFTLWTLGRSRQHRLYFGGFLAVGTAVVFAQTWSAPSIAAPSKLLLAQPYILLFLALVGMRVVFVFPSDLPANWTFRFHAGTTIERYLRGTRKAVWAAGPIPLVVVTVPGVAMWWGWSAAVTHGVVLALAAWISTEVALGAFWKIPFTCSYVAGRAHVIILWTFSAVGMLVYASTMASLEVWALGNAWRLLLLAAPAVAMTAAWRPYRSLLAADSGGPIFDEPENTRVYLINLSG